MNRVEEALQLQQFGRHPRNGGLWSLFNPERARELVHHVLELRIVFREPKCASVTLQGFGRVAALMMDFAEAAKRRQTIRSVPQYTRQLRFRAGKVAGYEQRPAKSHTGRQVARMDTEPRAAHPNGAVEVSGSPVFFAQLSKRNRRRVSMDPASKLVNAAIV